MSQTIQRWWQRNNQISPGRLFGLHQYDHQRRMVKPKNEMRDYNIQNLKMQIKHHEKNGEGALVMRQKAQLKIAERSKELRP